MTCWVSSMDPQQEEAQEGIGGAQLGIMAGAACCMCIFICLAIACE